MTASGGLENREECQCGQLVLPVGAYSVWQDGYHSPYECGDKEPGPFAMGVWGDPR